VQIGQWLTFNETVDGSKLETRKVYVPPFDDEVPKITRLLRDYNGKGWSEPGYRIVVLIEYARRSTEETTCTLWSIDCWEKS
jgi:hypothetical protein